MAALAIFNGLCELDRPERFGVSKLSWAITLTFRCRTTRSLKLFKIIIVIKFCAIYVDFEMQLFSFKIKKFLRIFNTNKWNESCCFRFISVFFFILSFALIDSVSWEDGEENALLWFMAKQTWYQKMFTISSFLVIPPAAGWCQSFGSFLSWGSFRGF